jgi:fucose permease
MGLISETLHSLAWAYFVPLVAYVFIAYYAFVGSRVQLAE